MRKERKGQTLVLLRAIQMKPIPPIYTQHTHKIHSVLNITQIQHSYVKDQSRNVINQGPPCQTLTKYVQAAENKQTPGKLIGAHPQGSATGVPTRYLDFHWGLLLVISFNFVTLLYCHRDCEQSCQDFNPQNTGANFADLQRCSNMTGDLRILQHPS